MSSGEEASIHSDIDEDLNEVIEQGEDLQADTEETPNADGQAEDRQVVKPKRVVRNPQPKLNEETLQGPRGIATLSSYFDRVKFKGRGHEEQDLNVIMKTHEYWCHRLFPKFPFDTCIERLEKLGTKRAVQTHIKRIRFDLMLNNDIVSSSDEEDQQESSVNEVTAADTQFDEIVKPSKSKEPELTAEQLERIRINKERAERLRQERARRFQEKATESVAQSSQSPEISQEDHLDLPVFDYESKIKGKQLIKKSQSKVDESEQEPQGDVRSQNIVSSGELEDVTSEAVSSNEAISHDFSFAPVQSQEDSNSASRKLDPTEICSQLNSENKENTSMDNIL